MVRDNGKCIVLHLSSLTISSIACIRNKLVELTALEIVEAYIWNSSKHENSEKRIKMLDSSELIDKFKKIFIIIQH